MFNSVFQITFVAKSSTIKQIFQYILIIIIGSIQLELLSLWSGTLYIDCYIVNTNLPSRTNTNSKTSFTKPPSTIGQSSRGNYYNNRFNQHLSGTVTNNPDYSNEQNNDERRLFNYLMRNYDNTIRPVINASKPINIRLGITLTQIFDLDEKNQVLTTNVWLDQEWIDEFLTWNSSEFGNITKIRIPCQSIWLPDIVLYNNADDYTRGYMNSRAIIEPNGNVFWPPPTKFRSTCPVDVTYFPFDDQTCTMKLGSWIYDGLSVDIENRTQDVDLSNYVSNGEWNLIKTKLVRNVVYYPCCFEPFPDVTITLVIRRKILYYMYNVIVPCIMMSLLTLLVFCLPPESGEKIALGVTVLLAFSVFMLAISEKLPETSESIPLLGVYLTVVMGITSVSILMTVVVLNFHYCSPLNKRELPSWIRQWLLKNDQTIFDDYQKARSMSMASAAASCCGNRSYNNNGNDGSLLTKNDNYHSDNNDFGTTSIEKQPNGSVKHNCSNNTIVEDYDDVDDVVEVENIHNGNDVNDDDDKEDDDDQLNYETRTGTDILSASELFSSIQNDNSISNLLIKPNNDNHNCTTKNINDQQEPEYQQTSNRYCFNNPQRIHCRKSNILNNLNDNYHHNIKAHHYYSYQQQPHQCRPNSANNYFKYAQTDTPSMVQFEKDTGRQNCGISTNRQLLNSIVCCATAAATGLIYNRNSNEHPVAFSKHDPNALYSTNNDNISLTSKLFANRNCRPMNNPSKFRNKHCFLHTTRRREESPPTPPPPPINYSLPESIPIVDRWKHNYINDNNNFNKNPKNNPINFITSNQKADNASIDQELIQMLRYLMHRQEIDDNINRRLHEWRLFSMFIDKVLFWIFTFTTIVTSVVFLLIIPVKRRGF